MYDHTVLVCFRHRDTQNNHFFNLKQDQNLQYVKL